MDNMTPPSKGRRGGKLMFLENNLLKKCVVLENNIAVNPQRTPMGIVQAKLTKFILGM